MYGSGEGIDLVITDLVMPGSIQGPTLAKLIRSRKPEERFIFISGYANKSLVHGGGLSKQDARLTKPISKSELILQGRRALDEPH